MAARPVPVHRLRPNEREFTPAAVIFLDTETRTVQAGDREILGLRLWVARYLDRRPPKRQAARHVSGWGENAPSLANWITDATRGRESVWAFAHNLGFDLTTTRLPLTLVQAGWEVRDAAVGGKAPWLRMGRGKRVLTLCDSGSWLPQALDEIARTMGQAKVKLPAEDDGVSNWRRRCGWDVDILAAAMLSLMNWWDEQHLGNWSISGAASGWNAYRHRGTPVPVVIDPDPVKVKADRAYVHGGRRGVWSVGEHRAGPFYELDFTAAYPTIAAYLPHPVRRAYTFTSMATDDPNLASDRWGVTARVLVRTDVPRWPARIGKATWYPVGQFWADLAGPEIWEARRLGCLVAIGRGEVHQLEANMADWARWCLRVQHGQDPSAPPLARLVAKQWGRKVIGKWSQHAFAKIPLGPAPTPGWGYEPGWDHETQSEGGMVDIAGQRWWVHSGADPENAYPAVHAWVESAVRLRLARVIEALGSRAVLQCDTDGMIVAGRLVGTVAARGHLRAPDGLSATGRLNWCLDQLDPVTAPLTLRVKAEHQHVEVLGPQHVQTPAQRSFAGLRRDFDKGPDGRYVGKLWPGLQWQLQHGDPRGYVRPTQRVTMDGPYPTGWLLADWSVVPPECWADDQGANHILPWSRTAAAAAGARLHSTQHPQLDALL